MGELKQSAGRNRVRMSRCLQATSEKKKEKGSEGEREIDDAGLQCPEPNGWGL